jgi:thiol-disulfide isomerase/thioredoxin
MGGKKSPVLKVDMESKIPELEKILKNGKVTIVLVFADWCGHCHTFQDNIWNPMCKQDAKHNRVSVRDDMIKKTSLKDAQFDYLPTVMVVDDNGSLQSFPAKEPEGKTTNAIPTPKSLEDMKRIVNVPIAQTNQMKGGAMFQTLQDIGQGVIPAGILGSLSLMLKGGRRLSRKSKKSKRKTHRIKK